MSKPIVGIDLGTSTSEIAYLRDGRPELLQDYQGDRIIPSVVQLGVDGQFKFGTIAKNGVVTFATRTIQEVKRLMGTDETITLGEKTFRPEDVSALILRYLKDSAEARLGVGTIQDVVISVPARFDNPAREATKQAAAMAGLNVIRLINEPTAAALSYGLDHLADNQKILVFDFGGGTLDVTVLEMFEGILDVKTSVGDDQLGGKDVDDLLAKFFERKFREQNGHDLVRTDAAVNKKLKEEAERYKKQLSFDYSVNIDFPYLPGGSITEVVLARNEFEAMLSGLLTRATTLVEEALTRAHLTWSEVDVVLPVGGSSRIPVFRRELERRWGRKLQDYDNPDEAVARGAAIAAGIEAQTFLENSIMILDNTPHRLGVATIIEMQHGQYIEDYFSEIIPKDAKLPATNNDDFTTVYDGQTSIQVRIYQALTESNLCADHRLIGEMPLENIPSATAGQPLRISLTYTHDGTLHATAECVLAPEIKVEGKFMVVGRGDEAGTISSRLNLDDLWQNSENAKRCLPLLEQARHKQAECPESAGRLEEAATGLRNALVAGNSADIERKLDSLTDILFDLS